MICDDCGDTGVVLDLLCGDEKRCPECKFRERYADCPSGKES